MKAWSKVFARLTVAKGLAETATLYATSLLPGDTIQDDDDVIKPFRHLLPAALAKHGMKLDRIDGHNWVVVSAPKPAVTAAERFGEWMTSQPGASFLVTPMADWRGYQIFGKSGKA